MTSNLYVSRVNQIDAAQLDEEIHKVLKNQTKEITKYLPVGKIDKWQPEINTLLKVLIWNYSLRHGKSTFGQELLNLHYGNIDATKSKLYLILTVLPAYLRDKLADERFTPQETSFRILKRTVDIITSFVKFLELANLLLFQHRGIQPRIIEKILGISSSPIKSYEPRSIGYSYMTRELVWHGLMELFTLGLPMINFYYLKHTVKKIFYRGKPTSTVRLLPVMTLATKCPYCNGTPILPSHAGCQHLFCYYCLSAHFAAVSTFHCPECDAELNGQAIETYREIDSRSLSSEHDDSL